jgi:hypothetical protein
VHEKESTDELRADQLKREYEERELADHARDEDLALQHRRRAEKASYLRRKLAERAESEQEAGSEGEAEPGREAEPDRDAEREAGPPPRDSSQSD